MGLYQEEYRRKCCTAEAIAERIESGAVCASGTCLSEPCSITQALGAALRNGTRTGIVHHQTMSVFPSPFFDDTLQGKYSAVSWFSTAYGRAAFEKGCASVIFAQEPEE